MIKNGDIMDKQIIKDLLIQIELYLEN